MTYLDAAKGYIADVPEIIFYRSDQKVFHFDELTSFSFEAKNDPIIIRCGHSRHPVAFIDALKEMNIEFETAGITGELFTMSASKVTQKAEFSSLESKRYTVNHDNQIILPFLVKDNSISIRGLTYAQAPAAGAFSSEAADASTILTFSPDDFKEGDDVRVAYKRVIQDAEVITTTTRLKAVTGSVTVHWPVYSGTRDGQDSAVKGYLHMLIYRVKLTEPATISTSYKTAATPHVSMMALDPKRLDGKLCQFIYEPNANGAGDLKPGYWPVFEKDEGNNLWVTVADRAELMGTNYVPIFDLANGDLGVTIPGDKDGYQLKDGELTVDVEDKEDVL